MAYRSFFQGLVRTRFAAARRASSVLVALLGLACQPQIGDECQTSVDCSQGGERLCDITQPGGYCTVFNCEPGGCPEDSVCIAFGAQLSNASMCTDLNGLSRFTRSFCMATCGSRADCRSGYACADVTGAPWRALVVDRRASGKVCIVPSPEDSEVPGDRAAEVCSPASAGSAGGASTPPSGGSGGSDPGTAGQSSAGTGGASD